MERYRIPKHKVRVRIRSGPAGVEEDVSLFLSDIAEGHQGPERPGDLFRGGGEFCVAETASGDVVFLHRRSVSIVAIALEDELDDGLAGGDPVAADLDTEEAITVALTDGLELAGVTRYQLPEAHSRLQDFLNAPEPFLPLYRGDEIVLINKAHVARVWPTRTEP
jgi:hypothetical protein